VQQDLPDPQVQQVQQDRLAQTEMTGLMVQQGPQGLQDLRVVMVQQDLRALLPDSAHLQPQPDLLALPQAGRTHQRSLPSLSLPVRPDPQVRQDLQDPQDPMVQQALPVQQVAQDPKV
jgi:hypothetical protein